MTHLAVADEPDDPYTDRQLAAFDAALAALRAARHRPARCSTRPTRPPHSLIPRARYSFVRAGIATYGIVPGPGVAHLAGELRPALALRSRVSFVKRVGRGERISYGLRHRFATDTTVATLPLGYADGVSRRLSATGGAVLIGGRRRPIVAW